MATIEREIRERLSMLRPDQQRQVLEYARALSEAPERGVPGKALLRFAGTIPAEEVQAIERAIEEGREGVDPRGW
ncbi:MAG TPA: hypothetical protein VEW03_13050 [Longimicrobiaceae bacterium]|nr:hypothetical protein [Longimicrobiaceae bacterium]